MHGTLMHNPPNRRHFLQAAGLGAAAWAIRGSGQAGAVAAEAAPLTTKHEFPFHLGLASYTTRKFDLKQTVAICQRLGLGYLCVKSSHLPLDTPAEKITEAAQQVKAAGINLYGCGVVYMKSEAEIEQAFAYAKAAGAGTIVAVPLPELLPLVEKKVVEYDIAVAIHNHGPGDKIYPLPEMAYEKIKSLDPRIGLCIDIGHTVRAGGDLPAIVEQCADRLLDFHVKDVSSANAEGKTIEMGRGVIDLPAFFRTLVKVGYQRVVSFEYEKDGDDPVPGLAESIGYVHGVLATL